MVDESRFRLLEEKLTKLETQQALAANDAEHAVKAFQQLSEKVNTIQGGISKLLWAGALLVLTAIGNFILQGGLNAI